MCAQPQAGARVGSSGAAVPDPDLSSHGPAPRARWPGGCRWPPGRGREPGRKRSRPGLGPGRVGHLPACCSPQDSPITWAGTKRTHWHDGRVTEHPVWESLTVSAGPRFGPAELPHCRDRSVRGPEPGPGSPGPAWGPGAPELLRVPPQSPRRATGQPQPQVPSPLVLAGAMQAEGHPWELPPPGLLWDGDVVQSPCPAPSSPVPQHRHGHKMAWQSHPVPPRSPHKQPPPKNPGAVFCLRVPPVQAHRPWSICMAAGRMEAKLSWDLPLRWDWINACQRGVIKCLCKVSSCLLGSLTQGNAQMSPES